MHHPNSRTGIVVLSLTHATWSMIEQLCHNCAATYGGAIYSFCLQDSLALVLEVNMLRYAHIFSLLSDSPSIPRFLSVALRQAAWWRMQQVL